MPIRERAITCKWLDDMIADEKKAIKEYGDAGLEIASDEKRHKDILIELKKKMC